MLPILRLSSGPPVHRGTIAGRAAFARDDLWIVFQNARDDRMAIGLWARAEAVDSIDAQGASHSTSNANSMTQKAAVEAAIGPQDSVRSMIGEYKRRRDWVVPALNEIGGIECAMP